MVVFVATVLVSQADGIASSLLLSCTSPTKPQEKVQYLFNLPESLTRLAASHGIALNKLAAFFLPENKSVSMGGFCSAFLKKASRQNIPTVIAPDGFDAMVKGYSHLSRTFGRAKVICVPSNAHETIFEDECLNVCAFHDDHNQAEVPLWLTNGVIDLLSENDSEASCGRDEYDVDEVIEISSTSSDERFEHWMGELLCPTNNRKRRKEPQTNSSKRHKNMIDGRVFNEFVESEPSAADSLGLPCFVCHLKAVDRLLVVLYLTNEASLHKLISHPLWRYIRDPEKPIAGIFHLSEPSLMKTAQYQRWMRTLKGKQIIVDPDRVQGSGLDIGLVKVLHRSLRLRAMAHQFFPLPFNLTLNDGLRSNLMHCPETDGDILEARLLTEVFLMEGKSVLEINKSPLEPIFPEAFISEVLRLNPHLCKILKKQKERKLDLENPQDIYLSRFNLHDSLRLLITPSIGSYYCYPISPTFDATCTMTAQKMIPPCLRKMAAEKDPSYIMFLGTGCAEPSAWRGSSALLLSLTSKQHLVLLDCGEGTYGQMVRYYGPKEAREMVNRLVCIWISHRHVDHCAGIPAVLAARDLCLSPVAVFGPAPVRKWLEAMALRCVLKFTFSDVRTLHHHYELKTQLRIQKWISVPVCHSVPSYGIQILFENQFSLVYSGDTEKCQDLVQQGHGCTLLIHESTHSKQDSHHARETKHSTWDEALAVGREMNAYRTILTHFSRRYPGLPTGLTACQLGDSAAVAFDGMKVYFSHLPFLPCYNEGVEEVLREIEFGGDLCSSDEESTFGSDLD